MGWFTEEPGGLNRMYAGLYEGLISAGIAPHGLIAGDTQRATPLPAGVEIFARRDAALPARWRACRAAMHRLRADAQIIAAHFAIYALPWLDLIGTRRFVFHFHGPWAGESGAEHENAAIVFTKRFIEARVYRRADRCVVLSAAFADILTRQYGVARDRIHIVPGGVDAGRFAARPAREHCRAHFGLPAGRPVIGTVRRLVHRTGVDVLIDAMRGVREARPDALLVVAGGGPLAGMLARRAAEQGLSEHVHFAGFVSDADLPRFYGACDLTVVPSQSLEGFGLTTIESLASGTPVLVTPVGGLPETVRQLEPSLVLADAGERSLREGMLRALSGDLALPDAQACSQYARRHFDWPVITRRTLEVYHA